MIRSEHQRWVVIFALLIWAFGVAIGFACLVKYETTPGLAQHDPLSWPANHDVRLSPEKINIVMLAHPRCPCSKASLHQLREILAEWPDRVTAHLFFWKPQLATSDWEQSELWQRALCTPGMHVYADENGREALRLGAMTSGHVVVYRGDGTWLFSGGITEGRGRFSDSQGCALIRKLVSNKASPQLTRTPVYGCPLFRPQMTCLEGTEPCLK